jgi:hypothetical protein
MHPQEQELYKIILIAAGILAVITGYFIYKRYPAKKSCIEMAAEPYKGRNRNARE